MQPLWKDLVEDHFDEENNLSNKKTNYAFSLDTIEDLLAYAERQAKKKELAAIDHSQIHYAPFQRCFYREAPVIRAMTELDVKLQRAELDNIKVRGVSCPKPIRKWTQTGLPLALIEAIRGEAFGHAMPTPIQAQALPIILSGRDMLGVAKTGSGKTLAFLLPLIRHVAEQPRTQPGDGPIGLIISPTRELAVQTWSECRKLLKNCPSNPNLTAIRVACAYGGGPLKDQIAQAKRSYDILVCTPGRLIDLLLANSGHVLSLRRVTFLVLDEADRMFDMGFGPQCMRIMDCIRPDRQTVLFSATFPPSMEALARKALHHKPIECVVGARSAVPPTVTQIVEVLDEEFHGDNETRFLRLLAILGEYYPAKTTRVLVFVERQDGADDLLSKLLARGYPCASMHGGKDQADRDTAIADFKAGVIPVLVATSVAARGLDVKGCHLVVNYECPNHMEDYVHRVGRTGRAGIPGTAITLIQKGDPREERYAPDILRALLASKAPIPAALQALVQSHSKSQTESSSAVKNISDPIKAKDNSALDNPNPKTPFKLSGRGSAAGFGGKGLEHFAAGRAATKRTQQATLLSDEDDIAGDNITTKGIPVEMKLEREEGPATAKKEVDPEASSSSASKRSKWDSPTSQSKDDSIASVIFNDSPEKAAKPPQSSSSSASDLAEKSMLQAKSALKAAQAAAAAITRKVVASGGSTTSSTKTSSSAAAILARANIPVNNTSNVLLSSNSLPSKNGKNEGFAPRLTGAALHEALKKGQIVPIYDSTPSSATPSSNPNDSGKSGIVGYAAEIVINDFSPFVRASLKESLDSISELTGSSLSIRGTWIPAGRPLTDRPLFLRIEGHAYASVDSAKTEVMRALREALLVDNPRHKGAGTGIEFRP